MNRVTRCLLSTVLLLAACQRDSTSIKVADTTPPAASATTASASKVDSAVPREVELERFREGLGPEIKDLENSFPTRDAVVAAFVKRLAARDTAQLAAMAMTKSEFAWLYYPSSPIGKPPYDLAPGLMYFQFDGNSRKGLAHALEERGGTNLKVVGYSCAMNEKQGENIIHAQCMLRRLQSPGDTTSELLFGGIIERHGRFKIVNFANKF